VVGTSPTSLPARARNQKRRRTTRDSGALAGYFAVSEVRLPRLGEDGPWRVHASQFTVMGHWLLHLTVV